MTAKQHAGNTRTLRMKQKLNLAVINFMIYICIFPYVTCQNVLGQIGQLDGIFKNWCTKKFNLRPHNCLNMYMCCLFVHHFLCPFPVRIPMHPHT